MSVFWPSDIDLSDTQSPREILQAAQEDWRTGSQGLMQLILQDAQSQSGNPMIIVHAKHVPSNRTSKLLSIIYRPETPYPLTIQPEDENLPKFLKKSYFQRSAASTLATTVNLGIVEGEVLNQWVADTPAEFREKLEEAFNLGSIKSKILSLASGTLSSLNGGTHNESQDSSIEN